MLTFLRFVKDKIIEKLTYDYLLTYVWTSLVTGFSIMFVAVFLDDIVLSIYGFIVTVNWIIYVIIRYINYSVQRSYNNWKREQERKRKRNENVVSQP